MLSLLYLILHFFRFGQQMLVLIQNLVPFFNLLPQFELQLFNLPLQQLIFGVLLEVLVIEGDVIESYLAVIDRTEVEIVEFALVYH